MNPPPESLHSIHLYTVFLFEIRLIPLLGLGCYKYLCVYAHEFKRNMQYKSFYLTLFLKMENSVIKNLKNSAIDTQICLTNTHIRDFRHGFLV